jgi:protein subunit release factor B
MFHQSKKKERRPEASSASATTDCINIINQLFRQPFRPSQQVSELKMKIYVNQFSKIKDGRKHYNVFVLFSQSLSLDENESEIEWKEKD